MPKINLDEDETLSEPIEIIIEGKTFTIGKITNKTFKKLSEIPNAAEQFAFLTGTKLSIVNNLNLMKIAKALQYIIQTVIGSMGIGPGQFLIKKETEKKETKGKND